MRDRPVCTRNPPPGCGKWSLVIASLFLLAVAQDTSAYAIGGRMPSRDLTLSTRGGSCPGNSDLNSCPGTKLPSNFCCPESTTCMSLNNATSLVCCPDGQNCQVVGPIPCDPSSQDATKFPGSLVKSTDTRSSLVSCGASCCPRGFGCQGNWCVAQNEDELVSSSSPPSSTDGISPTSTNTATLTATLSIAISNTETRKNNAPPPTAPPALGSPLSSTSENSSFPAKAVVAGFFPGMIAGALLLFLVIFLLKWRRERDGRHSVSFGRIAATVSDPIYVKPQDTYRTDFLRRSSSTTSKPAMANNGNGLSGFGPEVNAFLSSGQRSPHRNQDALGRSHPDPPTVRTASSSPRASTVSIDVFADPTPNSLYPTGLRPPPADTRGSHMTATTTFGDIMAGAAGSIHSRKPSARNNNNVNNPRPSFGDGTDSSGGDPFIASPFRDSQRPPSGNTCIPPLQYNLRLPPRTAKFPTGLRK